MPLLYAIDSAQQCTFMHVSGVIDDWELGTTVQQLWDEDLFDPGYARVIDAWSISEWRADTGLLRAIATDVRAKHPRQVALVARSEPVVAEFQIYVDSLGDIRDAFSRVWSRQSLGSESDFRIAGHP